MYDKLGSVLVSLLSIFNPQNKSMCWCYYCAYFAGGKLNL